MPPFSRGLLRTLDVLLNPTRRFASLLPSPKPPGPPSRTTPLPEIRNPFLADVPHDLTKPALKPPAPPSPPQHPPPRRPRFQRFQNFANRHPGTTTFLKWFLPWPPVILVVSSHVGYMSRVNGPSMSPFLNTGYGDEGSVDWVWVKTSYPTNDLQRGTVVVFRSPMDPSRLVLKRITALPGDLVHTHAPYPSPTITIPWGHVWVEGDNDSNSHAQTQDSNWYGPISMNLIVGKVTSLVLPWERRGSIKAEDWAGNGRVEVEKARLANPNVVENMYMQEKVEERFGHGVGKKDV